MQAPLRQLTPTTSQTLHRRQERTANLAMAGKAPALGKLTEVSAYGCCIQTRATWLRPGRFVAIALPDGPALESMVRWTRGSLAGLELLGPLDSTRSDWQALID